MSRIESSPSVLAPVPSASEETSVPPPPSRWAPVGSRVEVFRGAPPAAVPGPRSGPRTGEDNGFDFAVGGAFPPRPTGNLREQMKQAGLTAAQSQAAAASLLLGSSGAMDDFARGHLLLLNPSPPIEGAPTSLTDYTSRIPGVAPEVAWAYFVKNPGPVFESAGLQPRPALRSLRDGGQLFLEEKGPPPVWAPITVRLEPQALTVHITTLDGHPLRGTNRFVFEDDGEGGTRLRQYSAFQGSSPATTVGLKLMDPIERQHDIWRSVHAHLHDSLRSR